jgi:hypothetical protein
MILYYLKIYNYEGRIHMKKKIAGTIVCMLLIVAFVIPIAGITGAGNSKIESILPLSSINTYVDEISPYNIHYLPLTITATGPNDLNYIKLSYRWSKDNISWSGINEVTIYEGFESGSQNPSLWNTHQTYPPTNARIQWNYGTAHSGSYSCAMDDYDSGGDYALNIIYTNVDFTNATDISINFWEREWQDEPNEAPDAWEDWGNYDVVAFTNNGNIWYEIFSESDLNKQTFTQFQYDISVDPDFSSPPNSNFAIAFQQFDNGALTSDGRAWDDISIDYTIGAGINWSYWVNIGNPDFSYPWSWNFNFPNGTGYYEFYSIGVKTGEDDETPPLVADARCRYNRMPVIYDEIPSNGSTDVNIIPQLNISISDGDADTMTINWYSNSSGSWKAFGSNTSVENGTYSQNNSNFSNFNTKYWWYVSATDNIYTTSSPIFHFTTEVNLPPYTPSNPSPANGENDVNINAALSWSGGDPEGDGVTYDVYLGDNNPPPKINSNQSGTTYHPQNNLDFNTNYYWRIVAWDEHGYSTSGPVWSFTTEGNLPPNTPSNPDPEDDSINVDIDADLYWTGGDPNQGDLLTYNVYFGTNSPPPLVDKITRNIYDPGTMGLETMYYWQIVAEDSGGKTSTSQIWHFTTQKEPNEPPTKPEIYGPPKGSPGVKSCWAFDSDDLDEDQIKYVIEWGDGKSDETDYSSITVEACHTYEEKGEHTIRAKAIDAHGAESDWATYKVTIARNKANDSLLLRFFENHPLLYRLLQLLFKGLQI